MTPVLIILILALAFSLTGTPLIRKLAFKIGFVAVPKSDRAHTEATPLMGGVAIYAATTLALLVITVIISYFIPRRFGLSEFFAIMLAASIMSAVGLWDDRKALPAWMKLSAQVIPAAIIMFAGVRVSLPVGFLGAELKLIADVAATLCWVLYITNAINYLDNADGVAAMTSATASSFFLLIAILNDQQLVSVLAVALMGASLGFAYYNLPLPKSKIFMGDAGSLFLGFLLAVVGIKIRIPANTPEVTWMVPLIVLGLPIFDTALVFISRKRRGVSFFRGGVDHTTHRLLRLGLDKLSLALTISLIGGTLGMIAIFVTQATVSEAYSILAMLVLGMLYALWYLEFRPSYQFRTGKLSPQADLPN